MCGDSVLSVLNMWTQKQPILLSFFSIVKENHETSSLLNPTIRPVFTDGPPGPGPRAANFQGRHIKKIEIEVWYAEKNAVHEREI